MSDKPAHFLYNQLRTKYLRRKKRDGQKAADEWLRRVMEKRK
jgi:hypothetical protein